MNTTSTSFMILDVNLTTNTCVRQQGKLFASRNLTDYSPMSRVVQPWISRFIHPDDRDACLAFLNLESLLVSFSSGIFEGNIDFRMKITGYDDWRWVHVAFHLLQDSQTNDVYVILIFNDNHRKKSEELALQAKEFEDPLTGTLNRTSFEQKALGVLSGYPGDRHSLILIDINDFKKINSTIGHNAGDKILVDIARDLRLMLRSGDYLGRTGGDEFTLMLQNIPYDEVLNKRAMLINEFLSKKIAEGVKLSVSLGIAVYPRDGLTFTELYKAAEAAAKAARHKGSNDNAFASKSQMDTPEPATLPGLDRTFINSPAFFDTIMTHIAGGIVVFEQDANNEAKILYYNPVFFKNTCQAVTSDPNRKLKLADIVCPEDRTTFVAALRNGLKDNPIFNYVFKVTGNHKNEVWHHIRLVKVPSKEHQAISLVALVTDISEIKQQEEQLRLREEEYRIAIEHSGKHLARYDLKTKTLYQKTNYSVPFYASTVVKNVPIKTIEKDQVAPESVTTYMSFFDNIQHGRPSTKTKMRLKNQLTNAFEWYEGEYSLIKDSQDKPTQAVISFTNITIEYERELARKKALVQGVVSGKSLMLIVDDVATNRAVLERIFSQEYKVIHAENGHKALDLLEQYGDTIDVVLLDIIMPEMDGMELLRQMRQIKELNSVAVIVISDADELSYAPEAIQLGANEFVAKPVEPEIIQLRVKNALQKSENARLRFENLRITEIKDEEIRHQQELRNLAEHDSLTGLYSREAFTRLARDILDKAKPGEYVMSVTDIDNFKVINDLFGHTEGDKLLQFVAGGMKKIFDRYGGICCRLHADNFANLILYEPGKLKTIVEDRKKSFTKYNLPFDFVSSTGRYIVDDPCLPVDVMIDRAMIAKSKIKGIYDKLDVYYTDQMRDAIIEEQEIISQMEKALQREEFAIYLQPQFDYSSEKIIGAEALVRWIHPQKGLIPPGLFISIFERNGFISHLDRYVLEKTCQAIATWIKDGKTIVPVSVNMSRLNLYNTQLSESIDEVMKKYNIPSKYLRFEITESAYIDNPGQLTKVLLELRERGFLIEMDDFGSGYSSLNALSDMPVDVLKLDMRFILGSEERVRRSKILGGIITMAKSVNLDLIAEGVETKEQADFIFSLGCESIQGYYYAKPLPVADFEKLLSAGTSNKKLQHE